MSSLIFHTRKNFRLRLVWFMSGALLVSTTASSQSARDTSADAIVNRAFGFLNTNRQEARRLFERAVKIAPANLLARRQLGYLYLSESQHAKSLEQFQASEGIHSSDSIRLQIAYLLMSLQRVDDAKLIFEELRGSSDQSIRDRAAGELQAMATPAAPPQSWPRFYADPYYDSRWGSTFFHFNFQHGHYLTRGRELGLYGVIALAADTKSEGGTVPVIISDNSLLLGAGLRFNLSDHLFIDVQEAAAFELIKRETRNEMVNDFRVTGYYTNGVYAVYSYHPNLRIPCSPFWDLYSSSGYYSRYSNGIGYAQLRGGLRLVEISHSVIDTYLLSQLVLDTERAFYNNLLENGIGLRFTPDVHMGLHVVAEYHRGYYLNVTERAQRERESLYGPNYESGRLMIILDHNF